jgi:hypothetical protein
VDAALPVKARVVGKEPGMADEELVFGRRGRLKDRVYQKDARGVVQAGE